MDSVGVNVIETAALGRPFQLGMLYDCRKDALVPGITLWDKEQLQKSTRSRPQINTVYKVTSSDSTEEKIHVLNIDGRLELSLLGGLVNVNGAAKYLNDTKKSFKQQRLTLLYHFTSRFEELTMNHLASKNISHHEVFDNDTATHVVTGVLYGADACFVFDREVSSDENEYTVAGEVKAAFDKMKGISVGANVDLNINDKQKTAFTKFSCMFYGDFQLPSNPTSIEDALKIYAELPKMLGEEKELVVPLKVWLYPLDKLHTRAAKLQKDISIGLIKDIESVIEILNTTEMKCNDLLNETATLSFVAFHDKIQQMKQNCHKYRLSLIEKLGSLLPKIRGDLEKETAVIDLLHDNGQSPFRRSELEQWVKEREKESDIVKTLVKQLKDFGAQVEVNLDESLMDLEVENLVCYTFTSFEWPDVLLSKQKAYLSPSSERKNDERISDSKPKTWLTSDLKKSMRSNLKMFKNLINSKGCKPTKFVVGSKEMKNYPGSCILLYENECDEVVVFNPPLKPVCPIIEQIRDDSVVLKVPPSCPHTEELRLLYKMKEEKDWKSHPLPQGQDIVTLTDLRSNIEYEIKCEAVGKLNYIINSDVTKVVRKMGSPIDLNTITEEEINEFKEAISNQDIPPATKTMNDHLEQKYKVELNIAVTGESGSGKSTFVNAFRGLGDEDSAETGVVETTMEPKAYHHPKYQNIKLWDLPGIGTRNFKADEYLQQVQFACYDFFIIIASNQFKEGHTQLAKDIMKLGKKFYFVRSKIDIDIASEKSKKSFDLRETLDTIRENGEKGLKTFGIKDPVMYLISSFELYRYDFSLLLDRMEKELPQHKRHSLLFSIPNMTLEIIERKKKILEEKLLKESFKSPFVVASITTMLQKYYNALCLDDPSLQKLCERSGKTVEELKRVMKSPLHQGINSSLVVSLLRDSSYLKLQRTVVVALSFIPLVGSVVDERMSYVTYTKLLKRALDELFEDARNVLLAIED